MIVFFLALVLPLGLTQAASFTCPPPGPDPKCDDETEILCPGVTAEPGHCPPPAFCLPMFDERNNDTKGNPCPMSCPIQCDYDAKETFCLGPTVNGCYSAAEDFCVPFNTDTNCYGTCTPTCDEEAGQILCPGGKNPSDGCPLSDYCASPYYEQLHCPVVCYPPPCDEDAGEQFCDAGADEDGCWLGAYCAVTCHV